MMNQTKNRSEAFHRLLKSRMTLIAGFLILLFVVPLPSIAAQAKDPLKMFPATDLWPSVVSVSFPGFAHAANPDGTTTLHVSAMVTISSMKVPVTIDGGCSYSWCAKILAGAPIKFFRIRMYVLRSDGTWYWNTQMVLGPNSEDSSTGTYPITADVPNGVYAVVRVYAVPQVQYTSASGYSWIGWGSMIVLVTGTGTVPQ
jgi:hypothetical protein